MMGSGIDRIILLTVDCLRADHVSAINENSPVKTKNIDKLARNGIVFKKAYSNGPCTYASFPSIFTSRYFLFSRFIGSEPYIPTLSGVLRRAGYRTIGVVSNAYLTKFFGWNRGFDEFYENLEPKKSKITREGNIGAGQRGLFIKFRSKLANILIKLGGRVIYEKLRQMRPILEYFLNRPAGVSFITADTINSFVMDVLNKKSLTEKFFLWVHYMDTHFPYLSELIYDYFDSMDEYYNLIFYLYHKPAFFLSKRDIRFVRKVYNESIKYVDEKIGELIGWLDDKGMLENTLIIITADHGDELFEHGNFGHRFNKLYEELIRVPLIMQGIGNKEIASNVSLIDLAPTILRLVGLRKPVQYMGKSLFDGGLKVIYSEDAPLRYGREVPYKQFVIAAIVGKWKLIVDSVRGKTRLFNLEKDPFEEKDVKGEVPDVFKLLVDLIRGHYKKVLRYRLIREMLQSY